MSLSCRICYENYTSSDEITCTSCGHVFHTACLSEWQTRSSTCPDCRLQSPSNHRIYLQIQDPPETTNQVQETLSLLQQELDDCKRNFSDFHLDYSEKEEQFDILNMELETQIAENASKDFQIEELKLQLENSEKNFHQTLELKIRYENELTLRDNEIKLLTLQKEQQNKKMLELENKLKANNSLLKDQLKLLEILKKKIKIQEDNEQQLHPEMNNFKMRSESEATETTNLKQPEIINTQESDRESALEEKLNILEQKIKRLSLELDKEIENSTNLTVDNMKLHCIIKLNTSTENKQEILSKFKEQRNANTDREWDTI